MINLEQVKLLETKVAKAIDYVERLTKENAALLQKEAEFQAKIDTYQGRIDELEVLLMRFKGDQGQIEESILAALDKLSRFEKDMEKSLKDKPSGFHAAATKAAAKESAKHENAKHHRAAAQHTDASHPDAAHADADGAGQTCFEIPESMHEDDDLQPDEQHIVDDSASGSSLDPLESSAGAEDSGSSVDIRQLINVDSSSTEGEELDIF